MPTAQPQHLYMKKSGTFTVLSVRDDSTQCSTLHSRTIQYHVMIESLPDHLTPEGFIIDNNEIQHYFDRTYAHLDRFPSCEQIAMRAIRDLCQLVHGCTAIEVTIDGTGSTGLTAAWRADSLDTAPAGAI